MVDRPLLMEKCWTRDIFVPLPSALLRRDIQTYTKADVTAVKPTLQSRLPAPSVQFPKPVLRRGWRRVL